MKNQTDLLDSLLPPLRVVRTEMHKNATILEASDPARLAELAANPKIRRYLLGRLSDTAALVDPGHSDALTGALLAEGHTPKMMKGLVP